MNKRLILGLVLLLSLSFVLAQAPSAGLGEEEYENTQGIINNVTPIEDGKLNFSKWGGFKSKAEVRIEKINAWLEENASWLKFAFGMVPEISWDFVFVMYIWLLFFTYIFLNGHIFFSSFGVWKGRLLGLAIFGVLLFSKASLMLGLILKDAFFIFWEQLLILGTIVMIILGILFVYLATKAPKIAVKIRLLLVRDPEKKAKLEAKLNRMILKNLVEGIELTSSIGKKK